MTKRFHEAFTARSERKIMLWIARRLPSCIMPDHLTALGVFGAFVCFSSYLACWTSPSFLWLANAGLILQNLGDSLDGNLARLRKIERPRYGFIVDHASDNLSQILLALGFGLSPYARLEFALLALVGYLAISVISFLRLQVTGILYLSYNRVGPTEARIVIFVGNVLLYFFGPGRFSAAGQTFGIPDIVGVGIFVAGCVMAYTAAWSTAKSFANESGSLTPPG